MHLIIYYFIIFSRHYYNFIQLIIFIQLFIFHFKKINLNFFIVINNIKHLIRFIIHFI